MIKLGTVIELTESQMTIRNDDGTHALFWRDLRGWNKSIKLNDRVKVFYKQSILAGCISFKVTRVKSECLNVPVAPFGRLGLIQGGAENVRDNKFNERFKKYAERNLRYN